MTHHVKTPEQTDAIPPTENVPPPMQLLLWCNTPKCQEFSLILLNMLSLLQSMDISCSLPLLRAKLYSFHLLYVFSVSLDSSIDVRNLESLQHHGSWGFCSVDNVFLQVVPICFIYILCVRETHPPNSFRIRYSDIQIFRFVLGV